MTQEIDPNQLLKKIVEEGEGPTCPPGVTATVHYVGKFTTGQPFDSSISRGQPFSFTVGAGQVIKGWDIGVQSMRKGEKSVLVIPSHLAYGPNGAAGVIPPNATLVFEVELLGWN